MHFYADFQSWGRSSLKNFEKTSFKEKPEKLASETAHPQPSFLEKGRLWECSRWGWGWLGAGLDPYCFESTELWILIVLKAQNSVSLMF
jgi:hypothetical protein